MKYLILIVLAASFIGYWQKREVHKPIHQSIIASIYLLVAIFLIFGKALVKGVAA